MLNKILDVYLDQGVVEMFLAGPRVVIRVGNDQIVVPGKWLSPEVLSKITERFYSVPNLTSQIKVVHALRRMLDSFMYLDLVNIDKELDSLEYILKRRFSKKKKKKSGSRQLVFRSNPPGIVHFRFIEDQKKYLLVSDSSANTETLHELPMVYQLRQHWPFGTVLKSFSLLHEHHYGWRRIFELDAIAINKSDLFIFEMKNKTYSDPSGLLLHFRDAALTIRKWTQKMGLPISKLVPIIYLRHESDTLSPFFNHLFYSSVQQGISDEFIRSLRAFPLSHSTDEFQKHVLLEHSS